MVSVKELPCWTIMQCGRKETCIMRRYPALQCWEVAREFKHYQSRMSVCDDCIVYILKNKVSVLSEEEYSFMMQRANSFKPVFKCPSPMIEKVACIPS